MAPHRTKNYVDKSDPAEPPLARSHLRCWSLQAEVALDVLPGDHEATLFPRLHQLIVELRNEWKVLDTKIAALNAEFVSLARHNLAMRRLTTIPGIGVLNATALVAAIGDASSFKHARDLGAWLGLVPQQFTTGGKPRLLGRTKRGNNYLRTLLVRGARAAMPVLSQAIRLSAWLRALVSRGIHRNIAIVALANKLARIAWAVLRKERP